MLLGFHLSFVDKVHDLVKQLIRRGHVAERRCCTRQRQGALPRGKLLLLHAAGARCGYLKVKRQSEAPGSYRPLAS